MLRPRKKNRKLSQWKKSKSIFLSLYLNDNDDDFFFVWFRLPISHHIDDNHGGKKKYPVFTVQYTVKLKWWAKIKTRKTLSQ